MTVLVAGGQCRRCLHKRRSDVVVPVAVDETRYEIPLCESCADTFDREIGPWLRWATEVGSTADDDYGTPAPAGPASIAAPPPVTFRPQQRGTVEVVKARPRPVAGALRPGTYRTTDRGMVTVKALPGGGYLVRYSDGEEITVPA